MTSRGESPRVRRRGRLVVWAFTAVVSLAILVIVAELVVRRFPELMPVQKQLAENAIHSAFTKDGGVPDPDVGFLGPPDLHRTMQTRDYTYTYDTDRNGFSNSEPWPDPVAMVFLGDSFLVGYGVNLSASFPRLIAESLHTSEVNLGISASGPERQLDTYRKFGLPLHPRHVVTMLYLQSDFSNDRHFITWASQGKTGDYDNVRLSLARATDEARRANLKGYAEKSWVYVLCRNLLRRLVPGLLGPPDRYRFSDGSEVLLNQVAIEFAMAKAAANDGAIEQLMGSLEKMRKVVVQGGASLSVVLLPSKEELFAVPAAATAANLVSRARERLEGAGFAVLDLYPALRAAGLIRSPYFRIDGHLNDYGHRVVAETFVSWFRQTIAESMPPASAVAGAGPAKSAGRALTSR